MIAYLQEWLRMRSGAAPVWVTFVNGKFGEHIMRGIDETGVVLATQAEPDQGIGYPWTAVSSIARRK